MSEKIGHINSSDEPSNDYPAKGYIRKIKFNNGKEIEINKNDIVIFVGPNNVGKSQSLSDIYQLSNNKVPTIVISDIEVSKEGSLKELLEATSIKHNNGRFISYSALNHNASYLADQGEEVFARNAFFGDYRDWFITKLDTKIRLSMCDPAENIRRDGPKTNPIQIGRAHV